MNLEPSRISGCSKHPEVPVTGVCASCLRERLAGFDPETRRVKPTAPSNSIKSLFKPSSSRTLPELRRTKSFSATRERFSGNFEPQRKSCDVRVRNTLFSLFHLDDENQGTVKNSSTVNNGDTVNNGHNGNSDVGFVHREVWGEIEVERNVGFAVVDPVIETHEEEEEIGVVLEVPGVILSEKEEEQQQEAQEEQEKEQEEEQEVKTMKDHINVESKVLENKKGEKSYWLPYVLAKKLQKWRSKQRSKKEVGLKDEKKIKNQMGFRETQSEIMDDGRRSCDTDPRFSLDAGRSSWGWEEPRYSWDEPRASWDGYLIGRVFTRPPTGEDGLVQRSDNRIPVEPVIHEDDTMPGGTEQTRDYYSDSSSSRRKNFERSNSIRRKEGGEDSGSSKKDTDTKVSPAMQDDVHGHSNRFTVTEQSFLESNSMRDEYSESFDKGYRDADRNGKTKSRWSKAWNRTIAGPILGLILKRSSKEDERYCRGNVVERSFSESWEGLRNGDGRVGFNRKDLRCNSSVSSRNSSYLRQKSFRESNGGISQKNGKSGWYKKRSDECVLERTRSARYSPNHLDNGLLRFYLTPMQGSRRNGNGGASRVNHPHSFARNALHLY